MEVHIFEFHKYKQYLTDRLGGVNKRKGLRLALAKKLGCQPTYVSQVLNGQPHFSIEQAEKISRFLEHSEEEREYFFLLIQRERAGTQELQVYYGQKIGELLAKRQVLTNRLGKDTALSAEQRARYYSSWLYAAIHIAVTIPSLQSTRSLADFFKLAPQKVSEILDYLVSIGLVAQRKAGTYHVGVARIRLGNDSYNIKTHHMNWRHQAIESLDREDLQDFHYSAVLSLSVADKVKVKDMILDALKSQIKVTDASAEEELCVYNIDFFNLQK